MPPRNSKSTAVVDAPKPDVTAPVDGAVPEETSAVPPEPAKEVVYADPIAPLTEVVYPFVSVTICGTPEQHGMQAEKVAALTEALKALGLDGLIGYYTPLTAVDAQTMLGWEVEQKDGPKFKDFDLKDYYGKKVRLHKNIRNRPIYQGNIESISQDILMNRWELNGEPAIVSDTGNILDNQHTLISLVLAQQRLEQEKDATDTLRWTAHWSDGVISIPKVIVYGIKGTDNVVNTMNTGKPRTFMDVLYRSPYFNNLPAKAKDGLDRQTAARTTSAAVNEIWHRTGMYMDGYSSRRTNSEGGAWLESHGGMHGKFLEAVRLILEEDTHGHISTYIPCGKAVSMLWLGAAGKSDEVKYYVLRNEDKDTEAYMSLKWNHWKLAASFWKEFGDREPDKVVNQGKDGERTIKGKTRGPLKALTDLLEELNGMDEPMVREKDFLIARAWNLWIEEKPITSAIKIKDTDYGDADVVTGVRQLKKTKHQRFGNLDLGIDRLQRKSKELNATDRAEVEAKIGEVKAKNLEELKASKANGEVSTSSALGNVKPQAQQDSELLYEENPEYNVILLQTFSGKCEMWPSALPGGNAISVTGVGQILGVTPQQHPNDSYYLKLDAADWEGVSNKITDAGYSVALGGKVDGKLEVLMSSKPKKKK